MALDDYAIPYVTDDEDEEVPGAVKPKVIPAPKVMAAPNNQAIAGNAIVVPKEEPVMDAPAIQVPQDMSAISAIARPTAPPPQSILGNEIPAGQVIPKGDMGRAKAEFKLQNNADQKNAISMMPAGPSKDMAESAYLHQSGSGIDHLMTKAQTVKNPFLRALAEAGTGVLKGISVAGSVLSPGAAALIPGTDLHHQVLSNVADSAALQDLGQQKDVAAINETNARSQMLKQSIPVTLPDGRTVYVPASQSGKVLGATIGAESRENVADKNNKARADLEGMKVQVQQGQVGRVVSRTNPDGNKVSDFYNKDGKLLKSVDGGVDPAMLTSWSSSQDFIPTDNGIVAVTKNSSHGKSAPGGAAATPITGAPPQGNIPASVPHAASATPSQGGITSGPKTSGSNGAHFITGPDGKPLMKNGNETVQAYDPASQHYVITSRQDALANGMQNPTKVTAKEQDDYRQLNNRLADVQQKIGRYEQYTTDAPLSTDDKYVMSKLMSDQRFEAAFKPFGVGVTIPTDFLTNLDKAAQANGLSPEGRKRFLAYANARESMVGYQRILSGSGRSSEKSLQLQLDVLPSPLVDPDYAREALGQFKENLKIAGQGIPTMPGIKSAGDIEKETKLPAPKPSGGKSPDDLQKAGYTWRDGTRGIGWYK